MSEVRTPKIGDKVADCRVHSSMAQEAMHGQIIARDTLLDDVDTVTIDWPGNPGMPEMTTPCSLHWSEGGKHWFIPRLPTEFDIIVDAANPDRVGRVFYAMDDCVGAVWSTTLLDLTNAYRVKNDLYEKITAENEDEPSTEDLGLDTINHVDLTWNQEFSYWVLVDLA